MKTLKNTFLLLMVWATAGSSCFAMRYVNSGSRPAAQQTGFADGPNLYTYVEQSPWTKFDPDGRQDVLPFMQSLVEEAPVEAPVENARPVTTGQTPNAPQPKGTVPIPPAPVPVTGPQQQSSGTKPSASSQDDKNKPDIVWRGGGQTNQTFTPRPDIDTDPDSDKRGLSTFRDPNRAAPKQGSTAQGIDLNKIDRSKFDVIETPDGHVSIRPKTQQELEQWAQSRPNANATPHPYTSDVRSAATGETYKNPGGRGGSSAPSGSPSPSTPAPSSTPSQGMTPQERRYYDQTHA